jgi:hypothetical protein
MQELIFQSLKHIFVYIAQNYIFRFGFQACKPEFDFNILKFWVFYTSFGFLLFLGSPSCAPPLSKPYGFRSSAL